MASKRRRRRHRSRPAPGAVRAVLDGYAVLAGGASADTTGLSADKPRPHLSASVPAVARLWDAAGPADATPARVCLSRRGCWPGRHVSGAPPLPESVRWLAREAAPERDEAADWHGHPPGAVGAVVFAWRRRGVQDGPPVAVSLVALDARGFPVPEARLTVGTCAGAMFRAGDPGDRDAVRVWANDEGQPHASGWTPWLEILGGRRR